MNNLNKYVDYLQPLVKTFSENYNQFYRLEYYNLSAEDLTAEDCLVEFMNQDKFLPLHFSGNMPMIYAQWGEETGACMVLELSPENRKLLDPEVIKILSGKYHREHGQVGEDWEKCANKTVYVLMDHQYFQTCAGFEPADDYSYISGNNIGDALDFISRRLQLPYFLIHEGYSDLDFILDQ